MLAFKNEIKNWYDSVINIKNTTFNSEQIIKAVSIENNTENISPPEIDWNSIYINFDSSIIKSFTIPLKFNITTGEFIQLVITATSKSKNGYLIKLNPDSIYYSFHPDILDANSYTGFYTIYDLFGHFLKKIYLKNGILTYPSNNTNSQDNIRANEVAAPCSGCDLLTVIVYNSKSIDFTNVGYIQIINHDDALFPQNDVITGGGLINNSTLLNLVSIPNGRCVFGSLAYIGSIFGWESDPDAYIKQWAKVKNLDLSAMKYKLDNFSNYRPGMQDAVNILKSNFNSRRLSSNEEISNVAKQNIPIFVLIDWGNGSGHCVVVRWDSAINSLYFFDSIDDSKTLIQIGDDYFSKMKYFYAVNGPVLTDL